MEANLDFFDWIIFAEEEGEGKAWGDIDGIRDDAPDEMKAKFWEWIEYHKQCDEDGILV